MVAIRFPAAILPASTDGTKSDFGTPYIDIAGSAAPPPLQNATIRKSR
jgi:hypothetical protein